MSFAVFGSNVRPLYRPLAWKNYLLDRLLRKPFSNNGLSAHTTSAFAFHESEAAQNACAVPFFGWPDFCWSSTWVVNRMSGPRVL